jgi:hypothetical protein
LKLELTVMKIKGHKKKQIKMRTMQFDYTQTPY